MITIYERKREIVYWIEKGQGAIFTAPGYKNRILEIIKFINPLEFEEYGLFKDNFIVPIFEDLEKLSDNSYVIHFESDFCLEYYGKFDLKLDKFFEICAKENIPVSVVSKY